MASSNERVPMDITDTVMLILLIAVTAGVGIFAVAMLGAFLSMH